MRDYKLTYGYLSVGGPHQIYFETFGNPNGIDVLFLHGGPGLGFTDVDKRFFNPNLFHVIFFDQRGCGKSLPLGELNENHTQALIEDILKLLNYLRIDRVAIFAGSWGSTLALLFGIKYAHRVNTMILRGYFPATLHSLNYYFNGGVAKHHPDAWSRFSSQVPGKCRSEIAGYYLKKMLSADSNVRKHYAFEWEYYSRSLAKKKVSETEVINQLKNISYEINALIEAHYAHHDFFIPDQYINQHSSALDTIPIFIVQGNYDWMSPPQYAIELHQRLKQSRLFLVDAGHASSESEIENKLNILLRNLNKDEKDNSH